MPDAHSHEQSQPRQQPRQRSREPAAQTPSNSVATLTATNDARVAAAQRRRRKRRPEQNGIEAIASPLPARLATEIAALGELGELGHLLDALPDGVVIADEGGHIQLVNRQTEALFGYNSDVLLGQPVEKLMPERFRTIHPAHRADYVAVPYQRPMGANLKLFGRRHDGSEFPVEINLSPITVGGTPVVLSTIRDVSTQRLLEQRAREELEGRLAMLQAVLDELPVGVYLARGWEGELVLANRQVAAIWGAEWPVGLPMTAFVAASGSRVHDMQGRELPAERLATLRALRSGVSVRQHQEVIRHADGSALAILVNAIALNPHVFPNLSEVRTQPEGPLPVVLVVHQDVSALMEAERLKDEFVALAAHELRNPVASLLGYAQMLLQAVGPRQDHTARRPESLDHLDRPNSADDVPPIPQEWQEEAATAVMEASQRLAALTDDLLDATRLQADRLELRPEPLEVGALVRRVVKRQRMTTERHIITMTLPEDNELLLVEADVQRLEQVLTNLLSNAIKYSPEGGVIAVEAVRSVHTENSGFSAAVADTESNAAHEAAGAASAWVRVVVRDHGIGIPADQFDRIFGRFGRATNAREHGISGTGLGLYLCRELIERQGGRIWFESHEGPGDDAGTTFTFELPFWTDPA